LDLFSGIGGFALAASWVWGEQHEIHSFVEIEPFAQNVLRKHWPDVPIHGDIKTYEHNGNAIDLISGGFPCQPYSLAGRRKGKRDDRALWPEMLRVIKEANPNWIVGENVVGFVNMELDEALFDLETEGYETASFVIPACAIGAEHQRDRVWIVANSMQDIRWEHFKQIFGGNGRNGNSKQTVWEPRAIKASGSGQAYEIMANSNGSRCEASRPTMPQEWSEEVTVSWDNSERFKWDGWRITESPVCGAAHGVSDRVDRINGLGNAIVPQVVAVIFACIKLIDEQMRVSTQ